MKKIITTLLTLVICLSTITTIGYAAELSDVNVSLTETNETLYTVVQGDTLSKISMRFFNDMNKYNDIAKYNNIKNVNYIYIGQVIKIPLNPTDIIVTLPETTMEPIEESIIEEIKIEDASSAIIQEDIVTEEVIVPPVAEEETVPNFKYIDCDLSTELQDYTKELCDSYEIPFELAMAIMYHESRFTTTAKSNGNYGLMQINKCNHKWMSKQFGVTDFLDGKSNITCGVYLLNYLVDTYGDYSKALMCYNMGEGGAMSCWKRGQYSSNYSRVVLATMNEYMER